MVSRPPAHTHEADEPIRCLGQLGPAVLAFFIISARQIQLIYGGSRSDKRFCERPEDLGFGVGPVLCRAFRKRGIPDGKAEGNRIDYYGL